MTRKLRLLSCPHGRQPAVESNLLAVDPGVHVCGVARSEEGKLHDAWLHDTAGRPIPYFLGAKCVVEVPQVYAHGKAKARSKDLVDLSIAAGRVTALYSDVRHFRPAAWKGQQPKAAQHRKMLKVLSAYELSVIDAIDCKRNLRHNVLDAVCLLMVRLGRL